MVKLSPSEWNNSGDRHGHAYKLTKEVKRYILLPFMHSESLELHDWANKYFQELSNEGFMYYEKLHR